MKKLSLSLLSLVLVFSVLFQGSVIASSNNNPMDSFDIEMKEALKSYNNENEESISTGKSNAEPLVVGPIIRKLIEITFKELVKAKTKQTVKATAKDITTVLSSHAIERAIEWGITEVVLDNLLGGKPTNPMFVVQKYDDTVEHSRIIYDPGSENVVVLKKYSNEVITVYRDTDGSADKRVKSGRWKKASWIYDFILN